MVDTIQISPINKAGNKVVTVYNTKTDAFQQIVVPADKADEFVRKRTKIGSNTTIKEVFAFLIPTVLGAAIGYCRGGNEAIINKMKQSSFNQSKTLEEIKKIAHKECAERGLMEGALAGIFAVFIPSLIAESKEEKLTQRFIEENSK